MSEEFSRSEIALMKDFIEWYEWSGHDAFEIFDNPDEVIKEFMDWKYR